MTLVPICPACRETRALLAREGDGIDTLLFAPWRGPAHLPNCPALEGATLLGVQLVTYAALPGDLAYGGPTVEPEAEKLEPTAGVEPATC